MTVNTEHFDVREFGATGDGETIDTDAFNDAIAACVETGGGTVYAPPGTYLIGTIILDDNVTLFLDTGTTLLGSRELSTYRTLVDPEDWPPISREQWFNALVHAKNAKNIAIEGDGVIDANDPRDPEGESDMRGPHTILFEDCRDISIRNISITGSGNYAIRLQRCRTGSVRDVSVTGGWDGVNMHYCEEITISDSRFYTGDDCLAGRAWRNVTVTNCVLNSSCNAIRIGGKNVAISNCVIYGPGESEHIGSYRHNSIAGFNSWPGWSLENIVLSDIIMSNVRTPVYLSWDNEEGGLRNMTVDGLTADGIGRTPFVFAGTSENRLSGITMNDVRVTFDGGGSMEQAYRQGPSPVSVLPVSALSCTNVTDVTLRNVSVEFNQPDDRTVLSFEEVDNLTLAHVDFPIPKNSPPVAIEQVDNLSLRDSTIAVHDTEPEITDITVNLGVTDGRAIVDEPYSVVAKVTNAGPAGLVPFTVAVDEQIQEEWQWIERDESLAVSLSDVIFDTVGRHVVDVNGTQTVLTVHDRPEEAATGVEPIDIDTRTYKTVRGNAVVRNWGGKPGTGDVSLEIEGRRSVTEEVTVPPGETRHVTVEQEMVPGSHTVRLSESLQRTVHVAGPVTGPYETFSNTESCCHQFDDGLYLEGEGGPLSRWDEYVTIYRPDAFEDGSTAIVRLANPDRQGHWSGRAGLIVRNEIDDPDVSTGYITVGASPANGWTMEWDGDGDGRIDQWQMEAGTYTTWPNWIKINRDGETVTGWFSRDGINWTAIAEIESQEPNPVQDIGVFVWGSSALFSEFEIR